MKGRTESDRQVAGRSVPPQRTWGPGLAGTTERVGSQGGKEAESAQRALAQGPGFPGYRLRHALGAGLLAVDRAREETAPSLHCLGKSPARPNNSDLAVPFHPDNKLQSTGGRQAEVGGAAFNSYLPHTPPSPHLPAGLTTLGAAHHSGQGLARGGAVPPLLRGRPLSPAVDAGGGQVGVRTRAGRRSEPKTGRRELVLGSWQRKGGGGWPRLVL